METRLFETIERSSKRLHMRDLAAHQELQGVFGAGVVAELDKALIDDFSPRFHRNIAAQVDVQFACDLKIVGGPGIAHRVEEINAAATGNGNQRVGFGGVATELHGRKMQTGERANVRKMTQLFGADIDQEVL
jgi:hypothetical protein